MKRILVVEDSRNIAAMISLCLEEEGYEVILREDSIEAVRSAFEEAPDLVLLDLVLPRMSGLTVLRALRDNPMTSGLPVIVISARAQKEDIQEAYSLGADDYLVKPFTPSELTERISSLLRRDMDEDPDSR